MTTPTKAEVERLISLLGVIMEPVYVDINGVEAEVVIRSICDAYLAQMEEVKRKDELLKAYGQLVHESNEQGLIEVERINQLQAENAALRETIERLQNSDAFKEFKERQRIFRLAELEDW